VIRASYEVIFDTFMKKFPSAKFVFEASGYTIEHMAKLTPDVLKKLLTAGESGQCEFMGAPYSHPIMANIPEEDGYWSNWFAMQTYEQHLGFRPASVWNPECTWMQHVPRVFRKAGYKYLVLDFESYMVSTDKEYGWVERSRMTEPSWGGNLPWFDLDPDCKFLHRPFRDIVPGLHGLARSDRLIGQYINYFRGKSSLESYIAAIKKWSGSKNDGALIIIADDAEYTGTSGYYFVKYEGDYSKCFMIDPDGARKLEALIRGTLDLGEFCTFTEACEQVAPIAEPFFVENRMAWHRA
jgi:hypothetical protein